VAVTPSPIEDENNDIPEMNCWTNPDGFYDDLREELGHFPLHNYWGPGANEEGSRWILAAASEAIDRFDPDLLWVYVPHLDYAGQSDGPGSDAFATALETVDDLPRDVPRRPLGNGPLGRDGPSPSSASTGFTRWIGRYSPTARSGRRGLLETDAEGDADIADSDAFAMVDHQIAHVYADEGAVDAARDALAGLEGIDAVLDGSGKAERGIDHPNAGDLVLVAEPDAWFQYYWWNDRANAPPHAIEMDIHAKPGFDPCVSCSLATRDSSRWTPSQVSGSHGRVDESAYGCFWPRRSGRARTRGATGRSTRRT